LYSVDSVNQYAVKTLYAFATTIATAMLQICQRGVSVLEPYIHLTKPSSFGLARTEAVHLEFISRAPFSIVWHAFRDRAIMVAFVSIASLVSQMGTIIFPPVFTTRYNICVQPSRSNGISSCLDLTSLPPVLYKTTIGLGTAG
jgi:hypothetical protein